MLAGLVWLTSNHIFGMGDFWDKSPWRFLKTLKLPSFYSRSFNIFKHALGKFIPNRSPKHVITSTKSRKIIKKKEHDKIALLSKTMLSSITVLLSKAFTDLYISHYEFASVNNKLKEHDDMKPKIKNFKTSTIHQKF